jgi:acetyl esterase/lipase
MTTWTRRALLSASGLALTGCSAGRVVEAIVPIYTYEVDEGIAYGDEPRQHLDVYRPVEEVDDAPMVVFFYGGSWKRGKRSMYRFVGESLASAGVVTVVADYRLLPDARWRAVLQDCAAATRWAFSNATRLGSSPKRVYLMGHSAGAYNAAMLAMDPRWLAPHGLRPRDLAGWIGIAGPYDVDAGSHPLSRVLFEWPNTPLDSRPIVHAAAGVPRTLLLASREDSLVEPKSNTVALASRLRKAGVDVRLHMYSRVNHVTVMAAFARPLWVLAPVRNEVLRFVTTHKERQIRTVTELMPDVMPGP